ncbi:MAG TPA: CHASE2 domain-containing protein, partial [Piscirickettsiaceae bacterium]|nr:CHASE2 domain-containing protein [Piscirickettsiaceae bacterium]
MSGFTRRLAIPFFIALLVEGAGSLLIMQQPQWLKHFDQPVLDAFTRWQLTQRIPDDIVIVDIDDQSLQRIAPWPWPRDVIGKLLQTIEQAQPLGIGLDIVFPEPRDAQADQALAHQVQNSTVRVCIAQAFDLHGSEPRHIGALAAGWPVSPGAAAIAASGYVGNYPQLAKAARCAGHITPWLDADGLLRRLPGWIRFNQQIWPFLSAAMLGRTSTVQATFVTVPYRIHPQNWLALPAWRLLLGQADPAMLKGRWVLIGSSALGLGDKVATPIHPWMPGVVIHAELLDGLLRPLPSPSISPLWFVWVSLTLLVVGMTVLIVRKRLYAALA